MDKLSLNEIKIMKKIILTAALVLLVRGIYGVAFVPSAPPDSGEAKRQNADRVMSQAYGTNWVTILCHCGKTNHEQRKAMATLYKSALGFHK